MTEDEDNKYFLVEIDSNIPKEIEIKAESPEEAREIAQGELEYILDMRLPEFSVGRITESGEDKGAIWRD